MRKNERFYKFVKLVKDNGINKIKGEIFVINPIYNIYIKY